MRDFLISLTHVSLPSKPKPCHKIWDDRVFVPPVFCQFSLNHLGDQLDQHAHAPNVNCWDSTPLKETCRRRIEVSSQYCPLPFLIQQNIVSSPRWLCPSWFIWLGLYRGYRERQGLSLLDKFMQGTSCNQHARTRAWLLLSVCQFKQLLSEETATGCFDNSIITSSIFPGPHGRAMKRKWPRQVSSRLWWDKEACATAGGRAMHVPYASRLAIRVYSVWRPERNSLGLLDKSTTANLIQTSLPIIFNSNKL